MFCSQEQPDVHVDDLVQNNQPSESGKEKLHKD